jgi:lysophospholipase L1-like esterase
MNKLLKNSLLILRYILIILIVTFLIGEIFFRIFKPMDTFSKLKEKVGNYYKISLSNSFELKENYKGTQPSNDIKGEKVILTTDKNGYRTTIPQLYKETNKKILFMGDSYTFGVYVNDADTYPSQFSKLILKNKKSYNIINAGSTNGPETDQQYVWLNNYLKENPCPEIVILGFFLGNDFNFNQKYWVERDIANLPKKILRKDIFVDKNGFLKSSDREIHNILQENLFKIPILRNSHFLVAITKIVKKIEFKILGKNPSGWEESDFQHIYGIYTNSFLENEKLVFNMLENINNKILKCKKNFLILMLPINFMVNKDYLSMKFTKNSKLLKLEPNYYQRMEAILKKKNINYLNIYNLMKNKDSINFFPSSGEVHFNSKGNNFVANEIYNYLIDRNLIE